MRPGRKSKKMLLQAIKFIERVRHVVQGIWPNFSRAYLMNAVDTESFAIELDAAMQMHLEWSRRILRCAVLHASPGDDVLNDEAHTLCRFGVWFSKNRSRFEAMDAELTLSLEREHQTMHDAIRVICRRLLEGSPGETADLNKFEATQHLFIENLAYFKTLAITHDAQIDVLTGLPLRHRIEEDFELLASSSRRHGSALVIMLLDLDHFKDINDMYGHAGGDSVLRHLAVALKRDLRDVDRAYRYGGEEFLLMMESSGVAGAEFAAERVLESVRVLSITLPGGAMVRPTATVGVAVVAKGESLASVIERADKALYAGKASGRNCYVLAASR